MKTFIFKVNLLDNKKIIREIEISSTTNLYMLAEAIVKSYDFSFDHAFGFFSNISENYFKSEKQYELFADMEDEGIEPTGAESVKKTKINHVWKKLGDKMLFLFDYGDNWLFMVELKEIKEELSKIKSPKIIKSIGKAPEQYPDYESN